MQTRSGKIYGEKTDEKNLLRPELHHIFPYLVNQLPPREFVLLSRTSKAMNTMCMNTRGVRIDFPMKMALWDELGEDRMQFRMMGNDEIRFTNEEFSKLFNFPFNVSIDHLIFQKDYRVERVNILKNFSIRSMDIILQLNAEVHYINQNGRFLSEDAIANSNAHTIAAWDAQISLDAAVSLIEKWSTAHPMPRYHRFERSFRAAELIAIFETKATLDFLAYGELPSLRPLFFKKRNNDGFFEKTGRCSSAPSRGPSSTTAKSSVPTILRFFTRDNNNILGIYFFPLTYFLHLFPIFWCPRNENRQERFVSSKHNALCSVIYVPFPSWLISRCIF